MRLAKTEAGRAALTQRALCTPRERQVMILCDGQRTALDLVRLMGKDVLPVITSLQFKGYVLAVTPLLERLAEFSNTGTMAWANSQLPGSVQPARDARVRPGASSEQLRHGHGAGGPSSAKVPGSAPLGSTQPKPDAEDKSVTLRTLATKRSFAGTKMYMLDVLRTQRSPASQQLVNRLQAVSDPEGLCAEACVLVKHLHEQCGASYTERVVCHLLDILPETRVAEFCCHVELLDLPGLHILQLVDA